MQKQKMLERVELSAPSAWFLVQDGGALRIDGGGTGTALEMGSFVQVRYPNTGKELRSEFRIAD